MSRVVCCARRVGGRRVVRWGWTMSEQNEYIEGFCVLGDNGYYGTRVLGMTEEEILLDAEASKILKEAEDE